MLIEYCSMNSDCPFEKRSSFTHYFGIRIVHEQKCDFCRFQCLERTFRLLHPESCFRTGVKPSQEVFLGKTLLTRAFRLVVVGALLKVNQELTHSTNNRLNQNLAKRSERSIRIIYERVRWKRSRKAVTESLL